MRSVFLPSISSYSCMDGTMAQVVSLSVVPEGNLFLSKPLEAATENEMHLFCPSQGARKLAIREPVEGS